MIFLGDDLFVSLIGLFAIGFDSKVGGDIGFVDPDICFQ